MLQVFAFDRVGVVLGDLYIVDPEPLKGQEGAERGVRLEVRLMSQGELTGSIYSARPIEAGRPVWRADLLEAADGPPGSLNRAHHHPTFDGWEPGHRVFDRGLSAAPVRWVGEQLADLASLLTRAGLPPDTVPDSDARQLRAAVPDIERALSGLLDRVQSGELAVAPAASGDTASGGTGSGEPDSVRAGWL